jgi:hypothetical protein
MIGPDGGAAAARGHLRAAHADRELVITALKAAFVQGRLTKDELEARAGQVFAAKTYADLAALTVDIPDIPAVPGGRPAVPVAGSGAGTAALGPAPTPARTLGLAARRSGICVLITVALVEGAFLTGSFFFFVLAFFAFMAVTGFLGYGILDAWQETRSCGQRPRTLP